MSEQILKNVSTGSNTTNLGRVWHAQAGRPGDKIVNLALPTDSQGASETGSVSVAPTREWASAIELVREASEAIRISEERAAELEVQLRSVVDQAEGEMKLLHEQISSHQQTIERLEDHLRRTEKRAKDAETWLIRLYDAVFTAFGPRSKANVMEISVVSEGNG